MPHNYPKNLLRVLLIYSIFWSFLPLIEATSLPITYEDKGTFIQITSCEQSYAGDLVLPETLDGKPVKILGDSAFSNCTSLVTITVPNSVTEIGKACFKNCFSLADVTIFDGISTIGDEAFAYCISIQEINIPQSVTYIGKSAFHSCIELNEVTIPNNISVIEAQAFMQCLKLENAYIGQGITTISDQAFSNCKALAGITLPSSVASIKSAAFEFCDSLSFVSLGNSLTEIQDRAFAYGLSLESMIIPDSVTTLGSKVFEGCNKLTQLVFGSGIKELGREAFIYCESLVEVYLTGNAPQISSTSSLGGAIGMEIYTFTDQIGYNEEEWDSYFIKSMGVSTPFKTWLLHNNLRYDTPSVTDINGDGIELLLAFAFDQDPVNFERDFLPTLNINDSKLEYKYYSGNPDIIYEVQTSISCCGDWTTTGIVISTQDANGFQMATVDISNDIQFLRLKVSEK